MNSLSEYEKIYSKELIRQKQEIERIIKEHKIKVNGIVPKVNLDAIKNTVKQASQYAEMINTSYLKYMSQEIERVSKAELQNTSNYLRETAIHHAELTKKRFHDSNPAVKASIEAMINIGWYPDIQNFGVGTLISFKDDLAQSDINNVDNALVSFYSENLDKIMKYLFKQHPNRISILEAAFEAHQAGNYILSIPVFLTQIDGIAIDVFEKHFFTKKRNSKLPATIDAIEKMDGLGEFALILLTPLQSYQPITFSENDRDDDFKQLNRHQVLHGESLDYGTEINSYKAISLLLYIAQTAEIVNIRSDNL